MGVKVGACQHVLTLFGPSAATAQAGPEGTNPSPSEKNSDAVNVVASELKWTSVSDRAGTDSSTNSRARALAMSLSEHPAIGDHRTCSNPGGTYVLTGG